MRINLCIRILTASKQTHSCSTIRTIHIIQSRLFGNGSTTDGGALSKFCRETTRGGQETVEQEHLWTIGLTAGMVTAGVARERAAAAGAAIEASTGGAVGAGAETGETGTETETGIGIDTAGEVIGAGAGSGGGSREVVEVR